jgi:pimeloyl-ACP methyl ester carboxylesterase
MTLTASTATTNSVAVLGWNEPDALSPRGTLIVLTGRGESAGVYERFGRRLSAESYRVRVVPNAATDPAGAADQVLALLDDSTLPEPRIVVGSDAGAALALRLAVEHPGAFAAAVVVGLPTDVAQVASGDEAELRSACPVHRRTLDNSDLVTSGALAEPLPRELAVPVAESVSVPVFVVHGEADVVSPLAVALDYYGQLPDVEIVTVLDGRHDALNDVSHRSVAASLVLFLERLRAGSPILDRVQSRS